MYKGLWATLLLLSSSLCAEPLFWSAEKGDLKYLILGSVHVGDESMFPLPQAIVDTLQASDGLILEADIRKNQNVAYPEQTLSSKDVLSDTQIATLKNIASQLQINANELLSSPPWAAALLIQMKQIESFGYSSDTGVDLMLMYKATTRNIPVLSLETVQFQIDLLTGQQESGKELLISALDDFNDAEKATHCLIDSWKAGDLEKLNEFSGLTELSPEFEQAFIHQRNTDWVNKLSKPSWLPNPEGSYVLVVGTLHLVGDRNVLVQLRKQGFKVTQQSNSKKANCQFKS
ncbi:TraB/GumN family protein [Vibrio japonicus]|uniref:TraB/GumN family protein n=1 Tax=Vibrio japonicus TaxID=1824638 RepID=A0ABY5LFS6_9VIBR|nr:TraB/GumN family protein [Vibrio japonicus]UUM29922.1 TraB/GumN family protein [Vibrio japonicus]